MTWHALIFEVNSIQSWVFGSGKLRAIVGGSRLVSGITGELLRETLDALPDEVASDIRFARRAGGAFIAYARKTSSIVTLQRIWPLMVGRYAPGLSFSMGRGEGGSVKAAHAHARADMEGTGSLSSPELPAAAPVMERSRRTGRAAVERHDRDREPVDAVMHAQLQAEASGRSREDEEDVASRLAAELGLGPSAWPRDMEPGADGGFPYQLDDQGQVRNRYVALIHADGNGLGKLLRELEFGDDEQAIDGWRGFSDALNEATYSACLTACSKVLLPHQYDGRLPARPVLLGGDDLSFIVRADLALHFTRAFLEAFELETRQRLSGFEGVSEEGLTACAGMAYLRSNQPFYMGMELAEALCGHAKMQVREYTGVDEPMFSALCQHRCTDSLVSDWEALLDHSLTLPARDGGDKPFRLTMETWALHPDNEYAFPPVAGLLDLLGFFQQPGIARGPARRLMGLLGLHPSLVGEKYRRWLEMLGKIDPERDRKARFLELLNLGVETDLHDDGPFVDWITHWATPIPEVLSLKAMGVSPRPTAVDGAGREETA